MAVGGPGCLSTFVITTLSLPLGDTGPGPDMGGLGPVLGGGMSRGGGWPVHVDFAEVLLKDYPGTILHLSTVLWP